MVLNCHYDWRMWPCTFIRVDQVVHCPSYVRLLSAPRSCPPPPCFAYDSEDGCLPYLDLYRDECDDDENSKEYAYDDVSLVCAT